MAGRGVSAQTTTASPKDRCPDRGRRGHWRWPTRSWRGSARSRHPPSAGQCPGRCIGQLFRVGNRRTHAGSPRVCARWLSRPGRSGRPPGIAARTRHRGRTAAVPIRCRGTRCTTWIRPNPRPRHTGWVPYSALASTLSRASRTSSSSARRSSICRASRSSTQSTSLAL
ncbi:Uncharacterised protein [Mycobacteroides abscessus subsp. abscessus]|nr:Uncharacterised protein [Mycobacteroides abscessus subsp. abscessus]